MEWRAVHDYEGYYEVSDTGLVRSLDRTVVDSNGVSHMLSGQPMKQSLGANGYYVVNLHKDCKSYVACVHRLVAEAFLPNPSGHLTVNHIDGNKKNNDASNLEWASYSMNNQHAINSGLRHPRGTPVVQLDKNGNVVQRYVSVCEAARSTNIDRSMISHCVNGGGKLAGGYAWRRIEKCNDYLGNESTSEDELPMEAQEPRERKI